MPKSYFVVGGEYADTTFSSIAPGHVEDRFGPFDEREAHECWRALTGKSVDNALVRYFIRAAEDGREEGWYVVGGEYADTSFFSLAEGRTMQILGPFTRAAALDAWRSVTARTVDSALTRFDLCTEADLLRRGLR